MSSDLSPCCRRGSDKREHLSDVQTRITETTSRQVAELAPEKVCGQRALAEKGGVGAVSVVAFACDIYTKPSNNNVGSPRNAYETTGHVLGVFICE